MDQEERRKKKRWSHPWSRAAVHFATCFAIGALAALAPAPLASDGAPSAAAALRAAFLPSAAAVAAPPPPPLPDLGLLLVVTATRAEDDGVSQEASLARLAHTLRLVAPPLLWIVVGAGNTTAAERTAQVLRGAGVTSRHLTYAADNLTDTATVDDEDHQRNVALNHIERHRLAGVVHFAAASGVYDLRFFQQLRQTRGIAAWPVATVSSVDQAVTIQGPTCNSSQITGWYSKVSGTNGTQILAPMAAPESGANASNRSSSSTSKINISGAVFKSSMLWDSERFIHRNSSSPGSTQDFIQFVRHMIGDEEKRKGIPSDCSESQIMLWHLDMPRYAPEVEEQEPQQRQSLMDDEEEDYMT